MDPDTTSDPFEADSDEAATQMASETHAASGRESITIERQDATGDWTGVHVEPSVSDASEPPAD